MKVNMIKRPGGTMEPATDGDAESLTKIKTGCTYPIDIPNSRNPEFHGKMFVFLHYCFAHWRGGNEFQCEKAQFNAFRKQLTILAGFRVPVVNLRNHNVSYEAESLSFASMSQERFEQCYNAMIQAAIVNIFKGSDDDVYNKLVSFF